jgi:hypothetical protein
VRVNERGGEISMTDWNNKEEVLEAVREDGYALEKASEELRADKEVVMAAVNSWGYALQYASEELQADREVVLEAVTSSGEALMDFDDAFRSDKEVVLAAIANADEVYGIMDLFKSIDKKLQADKEVILAAVKEGSITIEYVSEELVDKEVILALLFECEYADDHEVSYIADYVGDNAPCWKDKELNWHLISFRGWGFLRICVINKSHPTLWKDKAFVIAMLEYLFDVAVEDYEVYLGMDRYPWYDWFDTEKFRQKLKNSPFIEDKEVMLQVWKLEYAVETECDFGLKDLLPDSLREDPEFMKEVEQYL